MALRDSDPAEVGGYRIEDRLGSGGMGVVYLARSASGRRLALKVVHGQYADDDEFRTRFSREVDAARQVSGAFTAPVVDADADAPRPWMATLYIPGEDLGTHVRRHGPLPADRLRELAAGLAEALRDIHRAGVVHRDLKPANVMLAGDGPRVIDFGISRAVGFAPADALTQTGRVMGTPPFMSPEQFTSPHEVGPATDVFSLGAIVVYAATRRGPFDSASPWETATQVVEGTPDLDAVPDELLPFVRLCLEKHPKSRPTPDELLHLLREGRLPEPAPEPEPAAPAPARPRRRRWWLVACAALTALAAVAATAVAVTRDDHGPRYALPAGWHPWHRQAKDPYRGDEAAPSPSDSFTRCAATGTSLVCAGDGVMAARFALSDGSQTWRKPIDPKPTASAATGGGRVFGTGPGSVVYVYGADDEDVPNRNDTTVTHFSVRAVRANTGALLWARTTGSSAMTASGTNGGVFTDSSGLDSGMGATDGDGYAVPVRRGVISVFGDQDQWYALLGAAHGEVLWKRAVPRGHDDDCTLREAGGRPYLRCAAYAKDGAATHTRISALDPSSGEIRWTATVRGSQNLLGQARGHLVLTDDETENTKRTLTLVDLSSHIVTSVRLARSERDATGYVARDTVYFTHYSGSLHSVDPFTGRLRWESDSTVEQPGPPLATTDRVHVASPTGRLAALDTRTGKVMGTAPGRDDGGTSDSADAVHAPLVLVGDALYVPYGIRSVYTVNVKDL
ncbi:protein kinase domain-containing protein [Streptomyces griseochromogenes]|uniref:serine/threonine-protein kinase n=1 Tax=Streptomyces griseochromogenes TaxID=68214 RepID=UPI0037A45EF4